MEQPIPQHKRDSSEITIGLVLKMLRKTSALTQTELAQHLGLSTTYIGKIEKGLSSPTLTTINRYAAFFGVKPSSLLLWAEEANSETKNKIRQFVFQHFFKTRGDETNG